MVPVVWGKTRLMFEGEGLGDNRVSVIQKVVTSTGGRGCRLVKSGMCQKRIRTRRERWISRSGLGGRESRWNE